ncbi:hypothetical protein WICPIJ_000998 [Wickerhamomyces pijperi]|uniref:4-hydroxy-4-methyl-2-oxoglutarate aldolase n=1 Tax=Wickerhamomyces pijperi TaxID=599730 RepID=A0A9P8QER5_WICPI|nr:hypothetical protein WICPIJ_000998 [Wickerhamomyces pijperi]
MSNSIQQTLKQYTPCDISDALQATAKLANGGYFPNLTYYTPSSSANESIVGPAYTVLFAPLDDPRPATKLNYIDHIPKGSVLVIGLTPELQLSNAPYVTVNNALYGGLMSTRAQYLGCVASVVFGRIRDLNEHRQLQHPVFALGLGSAAANGKTVKCVGVEVDLSILVSEGVSEVIKPGELIIGDENGVVRIPHTVDMDKLLDYIPRRVEADQRASEDIKAGEEAGVSQKKHRANL